MGRTALLAAFLTLVALTGAGEGSAAERTGPGPAAALPTGPTARQEAGAPPDSAELLQRARNAQARFERDRVRALPTALPGGSGCDDRVGRLCWRHGVSSRWLPPQEPPEVGEARDSLLAELGRIGRRIPGDGWVLGQRVWYLGQAGRWDEARALAARCRGPERGWCLALEGLALHRLGRYEAADRAFDHALAVVEPEEAAAWRSLEPVLDGHARDFLDDAAEAGREDDALRALWSLGDPLWAVPGNDRRTEHLARRTISRIRKDARNAHGLSWGWDLEELLLRYGPPVAWTRAAGTFDDVTAHEHPESRRFLPSGELLREPAGADPEAWTPDQSFGRSAYAPGYAPVFLPAPGRLAVAPRGDSALIVGVVSLPEDTTARARAGTPLPVDPPEAFREEGPGTAVVVRTPDGAPLGRSARPGRDGSFAVQIPATRVVASLEAWSPAEGRAGRLRRVLDLAPHPPDVPVLSDLLVLAEGVEPGSAEEAVGSLRWPADVVSGDAFRVGWEVWGLGFRPETLAYRLSLRDAGGGVLDRIGAWLGLGGEDPAQLLEWSEAGPAHPGAVFRSVLVDLPPVEPGDYSLRLELRLRGRSTLVRELPLTVRHPEASGAR